MQRGASLGVPTEAFMTMHRRTLLIALSAAAIVPAAAHAASGAIETRDGQRLFYLDKGTGQPVVFVHG